MEKCTTHDFSRKKKPTASSAWNKRALKIMNFFFLSFFSPPFMCHRGLKSKWSALQKAREKENLCENRENNFARAFFVRLASCGGSRNTTDIFTSERITKIAYNIPFFNASSLRCWCKVQSWTYRIPLPKHLNGAEISFFFNFLLFVFS